MNVFAPVQKHHRGVRLGGGPEGHLVFLIPTPTLVQYLNYPLLYLPSGEFRFNSFPPGKGSLPYCVWKQQILPLFLFPDPKYLSISIHSISFLSCPGTSSIRLAKPPPHIHTVQDKYHVAI